HNLALKSYRMIPDAVLFAKTQWLCDTVKRKHRVKVHKVCPSLDAEVYFPQAEARPPAAAVRIISMVGPSTPYRGHARTLRVLQSIQQEFGAKVQIELFGCADDELKSSFNGSLVFQNHGVLTRERIAHQFRTSDIFVDFSDWQAFGRTGLEAMACGCAV